MPTILNNPNSLNVPFSRWALAILIVSGNFFFPESAQASSEHTFIPISYLSIQNDYIQRDGVLVSKPKDLDTKIINIIDRHKFQSLEDYALWLRRNIRYQKDTPADNWSTAEQTLQTLAGDCEDYAFLNSEVIRILGYKPYLLALGTGRGRAHAICSFVYNGRYVWFDNALIKKTNARSLEEFAKHMTHEFNYSYMIQLNPETKRWTLVYRKS